MDAGWFFWKEAYLDYGQLLTDGFYHVRKQFQQLPTLADLISDPQLAGGQVIMVLDREQDAPLVTLEVSRRVFCRRCSIDLSCMLKGSACSVALRASLQLGY